MRGVLAQAHLLTTVLCGSVQGMLEQVCSEEGGTPNDLRGACSALPAGGAGAGAGAPQRCAPAWEACWLWAEGAGKGFSGQIPLIPALSPLPAHPTLSRTPKAAWRG